MRINRPDQDSSVTSNLRLSQNEQNSAVLEIHQKSNEINIHGFPLYDGMMELSRFENY